MSIFIVEIDAWTGSQVERLRLATKTFPTGPSDVPPNVSIEGRVMDLGSMSMTLFADGATMGAPAENLSGFELSNTDGGLDAWLNYGFSRRVAVLHMDGQAETVFRGVVLGLESSSAEKTLRVRTRDRLGDLDKPLLTERYAGTTTEAGPTAEGAADLKDALKPYVYGNAPQVLGKPVNPFNGLWQFAANGASAIAPYDGGIPLPTVGNFLSVASLVDALPSVPAGSCATYLAKGIVGVPVPPQAALTADVTEGATAASRSAAQIALRMLAAAGFASDVNAASFAALDIFNPAECNIYIDGEETALSTIGRILASINATIVHDQEGVFEVVGFAAPTGSPVRTFTLRDPLKGSTFGLASAPAQEGAGIPASSVALNWGRVWHPQGASELLGDPTIPTDPVGGAARRDYLGRELRQAVAEDLSVLTAHPRATRIMVDTLLSNQVDAVAEAARLLALHKVRRDRVVMAVPFSDGRDIRLGDVVAIDLRRFGWAGGKLFRVIGRDLDFGKIGSPPIIVLTLWG